MTSGQDPNALFEQHTRTDCDPANYDRVHKKPRCPVAGCKTKLTTINRYRCKHCSQAICLKHRDPADHRCAEVQAANRQQRGGFFSSRPPAATSAAAASSSGRSSGAASAASSRPPSAPRPAPGAASSVTTTSPAAARRPSPQELHAAAARQYEDPDNSLRGTAARRAAQAAAPPPPAQSRWPWQSTPLTTGTGTSTSTSNANPLVPPHRPEKCPQCGAAFETVARLIQHVEDFHPSQQPVGTSTAAGGGPAGGGAAGPDAAGGAGAGAGGAGFFSNPLRGLAGTTIAGGPAPAGGGTFGGFGGAVGVQTDVNRGAGGGGGGGSLLSSGAGSGPGADGREVYRCHMCSRTFNDPVMLVQHSERCGAAARVGAGRGGGSGASKDTCVLS
ncbi:hypothetical protein CHLRE_09g389750v5 [Chlamydomonas reinhardtii]|uniref:C2H2-type domain-containing protein n=1 Tax=Chlamydomonas reinhardtii TaxID=3055 RepID=A0A2K3DDL4_CHLRE|nr:uncharacterized protein CHLRE_09g389750v5 [Chlamydomonas reinhardtii]PNW78617.1 hypothetical protein CHLRE_09g389750v5 [Chlamydomonas reinhardtii]